MNIIEHFNLRNSIIFISLLIIIITIISLYVFHLLINPLREIVDYQPDQDYENITFTPRGEKDLELKGWFFPADKNKEKTIIIAHGYGSNRLENFEVTEYLIKKGYNVLTFDFRNSGQSDSGITSLGKYEKYDLLGAIDFIKNNTDKEQNIGILGYSMGAVTAVLTAEKEPAVRALVMDSAFDDLKNYLENNLPVWSSLPSFPFNWFVLNVSTRIYGLNPGDIRPIEAIKRLDIPVFFIHGKDDQLIPPENSKRLYQVAQNQNNILWLVPEAEHIDSCQVNFEEYTERVFLFFEKYLR